MDVQVGVGAVLHWKSFRFGDGASANKYFIVLGAKPGRNWLFAIATSKKKKREYAMGCDAKGGYYHIPGGAKDFFKLETWILLMECREVRPAEALRYFSDGTLSGAGTLRPALIKAIQDCLRRCEDVPPIHLELV